MGKALVVEILGDARHFGRELDKAAGKTRRFGSAAKVAGVAVGGALVLGLEESVKAAIDAEKSQERLRQAFKNVHLSLSTYTPAIEAAEAAGRKLGFTDEQTKDSLASLITATGNEQKALSQLSVAQDLARFKGVSLADATRALTMLNAGSTRALKQLGLQTDKVTEAQDRVKQAFKKHSGAAYDAAIADAKVKDKQATLADTLNLVTQRVHGQANAFSKTAAGQMEQFHAQTEHLKVSLGEHLLPALTKIVGILNSAVVWFDKVDGAMAKVGANKGLAVYLERIAGFFQNLANSIASAVGWAYRLVDALGKIHLPNLPGGGGLLSRLGHRASGGPVSAMTPYVVGEKGAEIFLPNTNGTIIPNRALGGAGPTVVQLVLDGKILGEAIVEHGKRQARIYAARNARGAFA